MAIKKSMVALTTFIAALGAEVTVGELIENPQYTKLVEAGKGGFNGENSFVEVDGQRVGRICAMTGAVFAHDNTDKTKSFFYKNGSYMIGAEVLKANARKVWEATQETVLQELEDQMMDEELTPKEWKAAVEEANKAEFEYTLSDEDKAQLIADFDGYATKEDFTEAFTNEAVAPFTDYTEAITALREAGKPAKEEEA